jgi:endonuclease/exonuclease/phosphatase family metal-dependent hydrolase
MAHPGNRQVCPEPGAVHGNAGPARRSPDAGREASELDVPRFVQLQTGPERASPADVGKRASSREGGAERGTPASRAPEPLLQVVEPAFGHVGEEGQRDVHLLALHPPEVTGPAAGLEKLVEVIEHVVRWDHRHEHAHPLEVTAMAPGTVDRVRIATWNVWSGRARGSSEVDEGPYAAAIRSLDADVLALQEVDRNQPRSRGLDLAAVAAREMGAVDWRFAPALAGTQDSWRPATGREDGDEATYGIALLSRHPVSDWTFVRLPGAPIRVPYRWPGRWRPTLVNDEQRVAIVARVQAPAGALTLVATHLSFLPVWNGVQLRRLIRTVPHDVGLRVLLGDLNMGPNRASRLTGMTSLADGATFPSWHPLRQIDHVLASGLGNSPTPGLAGPVRLAVSDHCALVSEIQISRG